MQKTGCFGNWVLKWRKELKFYKHDAKNISLFSLHRKIKLAWDSMIGNSGWFFVCVESDTNFWESQQKSGSLFSKLSPFQKKSNHEMHWNSMELSAISFLFSAVWNRTAEIYFKWFFAFARKIISEYIASLPQIHIPNSVPYFQHERRRNGKFVNAHSQECFRQRGIRRQFAADTDPRTVGVGILGTHFDEPQNWTIVNKVDRRREKNQKSSSNWMGDKRSLAEWGRLKL